MHDSLNVGHLAAGLSVGPTTTHSAHATVMRLNYECILYGRTITRMKLIISIIPILASCKTVSSFCLLSHTSIDQGPRL